MGMNFDDEGLLKYLINFVTGMPVECNKIRRVDLYGNKKPSLLFDTTTTDHHHVFTQLKKKKRNGKNFNRGIIGGGGSWKGVNNSRPVYNKKGLMIGFKKTFRFDENNHVWFMKEYRLCDELLEDLRLHGKIRYEDFVLCSIRRKVNWDHFRQNLLASSSSQCQETVKSSAANVIPSDHLNSTLNGNIRPVTLVFKESNVTQLPATIQEECFVPVVHQETPSVSFGAIEEDCSVPVVHPETHSVSFAAIEEECSVPVVHQEIPSGCFVAKESNVSASKEVEECSVPVETRLDNDIATYHKELDAYAASILETMVPYIPEVQEDEDDIPLFSEDFYIGHTNLWS
ncbi:uncharacterized protein LOC107009957 [Solanum pennellii]|uniref:Uncharacterized protein LOC107009957 n=1 Tax=Solanum pennellii TaxID=28526 RepID=A0ABM1G1Q9_SOLPN|nr:uncharacterized protein LOC107009957 [Solanum pennellii]